MPQSNPSRRYLSAYLARSICRLRPSMILGFAESGMFVLAVTTSIFFWISAFEGSSSARYSVPLQPAETRRAPPTRNAQVERKAEILRVLSFIFQV